MKVNGDNEQNAAMLVEEERYERQASCEQLERLQRADSRVSPGFLEF